MKLTAKAYLRIAAKKRRKNWRDKYFAVSDFFEGLAAVKLVWNGKYGFVNEEGEVVVPLKYDDVWEFHEGRANVRLGDKWGFIDKTGEEVIELKYDLVGRFYDGFAAVKLDGYCGYVDTTGKEVIPCVYDEEELHKIENIPSLSLQIIKKYERDPEGLELVCPEFDWKAWYEQVTK